jgi:HEAT repeat protein
MSEETGFKDTHEIQEGFQRIENTIQLWELFNRHRDFFNTPEAIELLISNLKSPTNTIQHDNVMRDVRLNAALLLDAIGPDASIASPVLDMISKNEKEDPLLRNVCARALISLKHTSRNTSPIMIQIVQPAIGEREKTHRESSHEFSADEFSLIEDLPRKDEFEQSSGNIVELFISKLADKRESSWRRSSCAQSLGRLGRKAGESIPLLMKVVNDPEEDGKLRGVCAQSIGMINPESRIASTLLLNILRNTYESPYLKRCCAESLGRFGTLASKAFPVLVKCFKSIDEDMKLRLACGRALPTVGPDAVKAIPALISVIKSRKDNVKIRTTALEILEKMGPLAKDALPRMDTLVKNDKIDLREEILKVKNRIETSI